jgi:hypothetical protein
MAAADPLVAATAAADSLVANNINTFTLYRSLKGLGHEIELNFFH